MQPEVSVLPGPDGQPTYRVEALGMTVEHQQWWQCATAFHALCSARGLDCPPFSLVCPGKVW